MKLKLTSIFWVLLVVSCKKNLSDNNATAITTEKTDTLIYKEVLYNKRSLLNGINVFDFRDQKATIEYKNSTFFGLTTTEGNAFSIFNSNYDLDLGEINLMRFDNKNSHIYIVELDDYDYKAYNLYLEEDSIVYYLGAKDIELSEFTQKDEDISIKFNLQRTKNDIELNLIVNDKNISNSIFKIKSPLKTYETFINIQDYVDNEINEKVVDDEKLKKEYKEEGYLLLFEKLIDINLDGIEDKFFVFKINKEFRSDDESTKKSKIIILLSKGDSYEEFSNESIFPNDSNDQFETIDFNKANIFTIKLFNEVPNEYFIEKYFTFQYEEDKITLRSCKIDKNETSKNVDISKLGIITFEGFNANNYNFKW